MGKSWLRDYIIRRLIYSVIIAWGVLTITFILLRVGPSSPADKYLANIAARGQDITTVTAAIEARYGLSEALRAIEHASRPGALKVLLFPD